MLLQIHTFKHSNFTFITSCIYFSIYYIDIYLKDVIVALLWGACK